MLRLLVLAVLLCAAPRAVCAEEPRPAGPKAIDSAIEAGVAWVLSKQKGPGHFGDAGKTALAAFTLHHAGLHESQPTRPGKRLRKAMRWLDRFGPGRGSRPEPKAKTYDVALLLMLLRVRGRAEDRVRMETLVATLCRRQAANGQWWYDGKSAPHIDVGDNSNTQFAALALGHAQALGLTVPATTWNRMRAWWAGSAGRDGGFGYASGGSPKSAATGSMTAAGVACLALADAAQPLGPDDAMGRQAKSARTKALRFLGDVFSVKRNHGPTPARKKQQQRNKGRGWLHYYLWSVERAMVLAEQSTLGGVDWYADGARQLLATQHKDGSWRQEAPLYATCFALLFLTRAADPPRVFTPRSEAAPPPTKPKAPITGGTQEGPAEDAEPTPQPTRPKPRPAGTVADWLLEELPVGELPARCRQVGLESLAPLVDALDHRAAAVRQRAWEALSALLPQARLRGADRHPLARGRLALWLRLHGRFLELRDGRFGEP